MAKSRNKGVYMALHLETDDQVQKVELVEKKFDELFGNTGRNRSRAIRWLIDSVPVEAIEAFPKDQASAGMMA